MGEAIGLLLFYALFALLGVLISALIMRWVFRINAIVNNQADLLHAQNTTNDLLRKQNELLIRQTNGIV